MLFARPSFAWLFLAQEAKNGVEVAYFIPPERTGLKEQGGAHGSPINWSEEVAVDARGNIYLNDDKWGTFVLHLDLPTKK